MEYRRNFEDGIGKLKAERRCRVFAGLGAEARHILFAASKDVDVPHGDAARRTYPDLKRAAE